MLLLSALQAGRGILHDALGLGALGLLGRQRLFLLVLLGVQLVAHVVEGALALLLLGHLVGLIGHDLSDVLHVAEQLVEVLRIKDEAQKPHGTAVAVLAHGHLAQSRAPLEHGLLGLHGRRRRLVDLGLQLGHLGGELLVLAIDLGHAGFGLIQRGLRRIHGSLSVVGRIGRSRNRADADEGEGEQQGEKDPRRFSFSERSLCQGFPSVLPLRRSFPRANMPTGALHRSIFPKSTDRGKRLTEKDTSRRLLVHGA